MIKRCSYFRMFLNTGLYVMYVKKYGLDWRHCGLGLKTDTF